MKPTKPEEWKFYKLHYSGGIPEYIKIDSVYEIKWFFWTKKLYSYFQYAMLLPRIWKQSYFEKYVICEVTEEEYNKMTYTK